MIILLILILIITIGVFYLIYKLTKKIIITILLFMLLGLVLLTGLGFWVYSDITTTMDQLPTASYSVLIKSEETLLTGIIISPNENEPTIINAEDLAYLQSSYSNKDYKSILGSNFKVIFADIGAINPYLPENLEVLGNSFSKQEYLSLIKSNNPVEEVLTQINIEQGENHTYEDLDDIEILDNSYARFMMLTLALEQGQFESLSEDKLILSILRSYHSGDIQIYKETITLKLIKLVPLGLVEAIIAATTK